MPDASALHEAREARGAEALAVELAHFDRDVPLGDRHDVVGVRLAAQAIRDRGAGVRDEDRGLELDVMVAQVSGPDHVVMPRKEEIRASALKNLQRARAAPDDR